MDKLEDIVLSNISQTMANIIWFYLSEEPRIGEFLETESRLKVIRVRGGAMGSSCLMDTEFLLEVDSGDAWTLWM